MPSPITNNAIIFVDNHNDAPSSCIAQSIVFDYATALSDDKHRWNAYDIVLLAECNSTDDQQYTTIFEMALNGLEQFDVDRKVRKFVEQNIHKCKRVLVIVDGYDDEADDCLQLDNIMSSIGGSEMDDDLGFDLIVVTTQTAIERTINVTWLNVIDSNRPNTALDKKT